MTLSEAMFIGGVLTAPPMLAALLILILLVVIIGHVLALAGRVIVIVLGVILGLWLLGAVGITPL